MKIRDLFVADVTRDIPPVVYFHEQSPARLASEVGEYIITGGYPPDDPRARRVPSGIHEEFVRLLRNIVRELAKPGGPELPASWISGFYGSGKSSFAKLLGLALDGVVLPDGATLATALLRRDDAPRARELSDAWEALGAKIEPIAVVFDVGGVARDNEHIHAAVVRKVQERLGYCPRSNLVAEYELKLERDGVWDRFTGAAETILGKPWEQAKREELAEDHFSEVLHGLFPERYRDPTSWIDSRAGARTGAGSSAGEAVEAIEAMLALRAKGKTLFIVVDEVSQYVHQDESRMLKLQSFVSELGQRLRGGVWLVATGQQKLDEQAETTNLGKLKDRFPASLRIHLASTNIRDVVHKRLLRKSPDKEKPLRELFQQHRSDLRLHGYECQDITEEDFVEVYPMLPGHVDLLMRITSNLRTRSTRIQGDDQAIRGLLQLLGELFREQKLADKDVGHLVTLDAIFAVQQSALDADTQNSLARIADHPDVRGNVLAQRAARAVALLQLIQEEKPTTAELVGQCLYDELGKGTAAQTVTDALEKLRAGNLVSYSEKHGYKIQSSAGQEWQKLRDDIGIPNEQLSAVVRDKLVGLIKLPERPRLKGAAFPWSAWFSDARSLRDERIVDPRTDANVTVDFRYLRNKDDRAQAKWVQESDQSALHDRLVWVVGEPGAIDDVARQYAKSKKMVEQYETRRASLSYDTQRLLIEEQTRLEELEKRVHDAIAEAFLDGTIYFRGLAIRPRDKASAFATALLAVGTESLPKLYPHFTDIAITDKELGQLLDKTLAGPSTKFLESGLGILALDAGRYVASCAGAVPSRVLQHIEQEKGIAGHELMAHFARPPYGYATDVVKACLAGLLRAGKVRIRPEQGAMITSINDPGARDLFDKDRGLRRAEVFPGRDEGVTAKDRVAVCKFFEKHVGVTLDRENDAIADAVFQQFPARRERLRELEAQLAKLPGTARPAALEKLRKALEDCLRSRQVEDTVLAVKQNLEALGDGLEQLGMLQSELGNDAIEAVSDAGDVREHDLAQLRAVGALGGLEADERAIDAQMASDRPWRDIRALGAAVERVRGRYVETRRALLAKQAAEAEAVRGRIKVRPGFERLDSEQGYRVLRPIADAVFDTTPEQRYPTLAELNERFPAKLHSAENAADEALDDELTRATERPVVKIELKLRGQEIETREQLSALLREIEERIGEQLAKGVRVRLG